MLKGWKSYIVNGVLFIGALISFVAPGADIPTAEQAEAAGAVVEKAVDTSVEIWTMALTFGNMVLRAFQTGPAAFKWFGWLAAMLGKK